MSKINSMTADQIATKWANNLAAATTEIQNGVQAVTVAPGQAAARQKSAYVANVQAKADKWATNTAAVTLSDWQSAMVTKGLPRVATGATAAQPKMSSVMQQLIPYIQNAQRALPARGTLQQNIARATAMITAMSNFQKK